MATPPPNDQQLGQAQGQPVVHREVHVQAEPVVVHQSAVVVEQKETVVVGPTFVRYQFMESGPPTKFIFFWTMPFMKAVFFMGVALCAAWLVSSIFWFSTDYARGNGGCTFCFLITGILMICAAIFGHWGIFLAAFIFSVIGLVLNGLCILLFLLVVGSYGCWFSCWGGALVVFFIFFLIIIVINFVLNLLAAWYCWKGYKYMKTSAIVAYLVPA